MLAEMGEHQPTIRDYLRHSNLHVTNKYLQATSKTKRSAQESQARLFSAATARRQPSQSSIRSGNPIPEPRRRRKEPPHQLSVVLIEVIEAENARDEPDAKERPSFPIPQRTGSNKQRRSKSKQYCAGLKYYLPTKGSWTTSANRPLLAVLLVGAYKRLTYR
jgi:hypothetical protein